MFFIGFSFFVQTPKIVNIKNGFKFFFSHFEKILSNLIKNVLCHQSLSYVCVVEDLYIVSYMFFVDLFISNIWQNWHIGHMFVLSELFLFFDINHIQICQIS